MSEMTETAGTPAKRKDHAPVPAAPLLPLRPAGKPWGLAEAAEFLGVTTKHLRYLADTGRVSTIRLGKRKRAISDAEMKRLSREGV